MDMMHLMIMYNNMKNIFIFMILLCITSIVNAQNVEKDTTSIENNYSFGDPDDDCRHCIAPPGGGGGEPSPDVCPAGRPDALELVQNFISSPDFAAERARAGVQYVQNPLVRVLVGANDSGDNPLCSRFNSYPRNTDTFKYPEWSRIYYKSGINYFIVYSLNIDASNSIYGIPFIVIGNDARSVKEAFLIN